MISKYLRLFLRKISLFVIGWLKVMIVKIEEKIVKLNEETKKENGVQVESNVDEESRALLNTHVSGEFLHKNRVIRVGNSPICKIPAGKEMIVPPMDKQKMIDELFENTTYEDVEKMGNELRQIMGSRAELPWLIHYMLMERVSQEPDRHVMYLKLVNSLNSDVFDKSIVSNTIENLRVMLSTKSRYDIYTMRNLSYFLSLITRSGRRAAFVDANVLEKILVDVKKCTENLLSGAGKKFAKNVNNTNSTPSTQQHTAGRR